jgi:hypothetical protein
VTQERDQPFDGSVKTSVVPTIRLDGEPPQRLLFGNAAYFLGVVQKRFKALK